MHGGHHFVIGHSHDICQDYAMSSDEFASLSDGCSRVFDEQGQLIEAHTDVGARVMVMAAAKCAKGEGWSLATRADRMRRTIGLPLQCLAATSISLYRDADCIVGHVVGDGMVAARSLDGIWQIWKYEYPTRPFYPLHDIVGGFEDSPQRTDVASGTAVPVPRHAYESFPMRLYDMVVAASDGAFSFTQHNRPVPFTYEFSQRLLDFRRMKGAFMVRHLRGVLRELESDNIVNQDDISMIALCVE